MGSILVIDDQPLAGEMIAFVLSRHRPDLRYIGQAINAQSGIDLARQAGVDIVFLDIKMPGMDGIEAIGHLCAACPQTQIIMLTAFDDFEFIRSAMRAGARDYLLKPVRPEEILEAIKRCEAPPNAATPFLARADGQMDAADALKALIVCGDEDGAELAADAYLEALHLMDAPNFMHVCVHCMELASHVLDARTEAGIAGEGLGFLYQEFIRRASAPLNRDELGRLLRQFARQSADMFARPLGDPGFALVVRAKQYVLAHLDENTSLQKVAGRLFLSPAYLSRLFREKTGETFSGFVSDCRIERAKLLLSTTDLPVCEVAASLGYEETNSFSRFFKNKTGHPPTHFRLGDGE